MRHFTLALLLLTSFGCASLPKDPYWKAELAWQIGHGIDTFQTINGPGRNGHCFEESNPVTKRLIGKNPSVGQVAVWGVGTGLAHYGVSKWLESVNAKPWIKGAWQAVTIYYVADTIIGNHQEGVRPWGDNIGCQ